MTNKPMLSVERKVIEDILADAREPGTDYMTARKVLRALLDKPVQPPVADLLLASAHSYVKVAGETQNLARHLQSRIEVYFDGEPAAQYHSEPVALYSRCTILKDCKVKSSPASGARINAIAKPITRRVCYGCVGLKREAFCCVCDEEQPAPVAILLPDRMVMPERRAIHTAWDHAYNAAIADVARLNGVKP